MIYTSVEPDENKNSSGEFRHLITPEPNFKITIIFLISGGRAELFYIDLTDPMTK